MLLHADPACTDAQRELDALRATLEDADSSPSSLTYAALKPLAAPLPAAAPPAESYAQNTNAQTNNCAGAAKQFTQCMDEHQGNMSICGWYMENLKACQAAAAPY